MLLLKKSAYLVFLPYISALLSQNNRQLIEFPCAIGDGAVGESRSSQRGAGVSSARALRHRGAANSCAVRAAKVIFLLLLLPKLAMAVGVGDIRLHSALNEPLKADIEMFGLQGVDPASITFSLGSHDDFEQAGIERPIFLNTVRLAWYTAETGQRFIRLTSGKVLQEPYLNFLLRVHWPQGKLLREYTLLLDPPLWQPLASPPRHSTWAASATPAEPANRQAANVPPLLPSPTESLSLPSAETAVVAAKQPEPVAVLFTEKNVAAEAVQRSVKRHFIQPGEKLWDIAQRYLPNQQVTVAAMMAAIVAKNPQVFVDNNVDKMMAGMWLQLPEKVDGIVSQALTTQQQHAQQKKDTPTVADKAIAAPQQSERIAPTASVEPSPVAASLLLTTSDQLRLLPVESQEENNAQATSTLTVAAIKEELLLAKETVQVAKRENELLQEKVSLFHQQIASLQALLAIKNNEVAELKSLVAKGETEPLPTVPRELPILPQLSEAATVAVTDKNTTPLPQQSNVESTVKQQTSRAAVDDRQAHSFGWRWSTASGTAVILLLLLIGLLIAYRFTKQKQGSHGNDNAVGPVLHDSALPVQGENTAQQHSSFEINEGSVADGSDTLALAKQFMQFSQYTEAEQLLQSLLVAEPNNNEARLLLLQVYVTLNNQQAFKSTQQGFADLKQQLPLQQTVQELYNSQWPEACLSTADPVAQQRADGTAKEAALAASHGNNAEDREKMAANELDAKLKVKMRLVKAYIDMGDSKGAQEIMAEIRAIAEERHQAAIKELQVLLDI